MYDVGGFMEMSLLVFLSLHFVCFCCFLVWALSGLAVMCHEWGMHWLKIQALRNLGGLTSFGLVCLLLVYMDHHFALTCTLVSLSSTEMTKRGLRGLASSLEDNASLEALRYSMHG